MHINTTHHKFPPLAHDGIVIVGPIIVTRDNPYLFLIPLKIPIPAPTYSQNLPSSLFTPISIFLLFSHPPAPPSTNAACIRLSLSVGLLHVAAPPSLTPSHISSPLSEISRALLSHLQEPSIILRYEF